MIRSNDWMGEIILGYRNLQIKHACQLPRFDNKILHTLYMTSTNTNYNTGSHNANSRNKHINRMNSIVNFKVFRDFD